MSRSGKLPNEVHTSQPWLIHEIAPEFRLEDVWALNTPGGPDDFHRLVELVAAASTGESPSPVVRALFAVRWTVGGLLGWDRPENDFAKRSPTLRDRVPEDVRDPSKALPEFRALPFKTLYLLDNEWAAELVSQTVHGVMHVCWVPDAAAADQGGYRGQLAVYVKPNGLLGESYMALIKPFRYLFVYPAMLRRAERLWREGRQASPAKPAGQQA